jgi:hypothetical protein
MDNGLILPYRGPGDQDAGGARGRLDAGGAAGVPPTEPVGGAARQIQRPVTSKGGNRGLTVPMRLTPCLQEKPRRRCPERARTKTNTRGQGEDPKVLG